MENAVLHSDSAISGEVMARHYATGQPIRLEWKEGCISRIGLAPDGPDDLWIAPALVDVQINGYGGVDFQQDNLSEEDLLSAGRQLRNDGCATWLLTLITDDWARLMARLRHLRKLRARSAELRSAIAGWHIEGPFLSAEPGFRGAHNPDVMCDPKPEHIRELREITENDPVLLTLAPERAAIACISLACSLGIKVSLGHTNASQEVLMQAVRAGATGFTHLGNGCPRELDRQDNILWRALEIPELTVSLIVDGVHVSPALFRLFHHVLRPESIFYTTDAMAAAGAPPGKYKIGRLELEVGEDQIVRLPGTRNFAGSALRPIDGVLRAAQMLGRPWQEVWPRFTAAPGRFMGLTAGELTVGAPARFCLLEEKKAGQVRLIRTDAPFRGFEESG